MKNAILLALVLVFAACKKDKTEPEKEPTIEEKIQGKWQLVRAVDQVWQPMDTLTHSQDNPVGPGDSVIFKRNTILGYSDMPNGVDVEELEVTFTNEDLLIVDDEFWIIRTLNDHELVLEQTEIDVANDRKDVLINYLVR